MMNSLPINKQALAVALAAEKRQAIRRSYLRAGILAVAGALMILLSALGHDRSDLSLVYGTRKSDVTLVKVHGGTDPFNGMVAWTPPATKSEAAAKRAWASNWFHAHPKHTVTLTKNR